MELVYLWVEDYKNIHKQGFNFSPRFSCKYDDVKKELTIKKNNDYIENFFGKNINITAIVGKNGSGKTTLLKYIIEIIERIFSHNSLITRPISEQIKNEFIFVFYQNKNTSYILHPSHLKVIENEKTSINFKQFIYLELGKIQQIPFRHRVRIGNQYMVEEYLLNHNIEELKKKIFGFYVNNHGLNSIKYFSNQIENYDNAFYDKLVIARYLVSQKKFIDKENKYFEINDIFLRISTRKYHSSLNSPLEGIKSIINQALKQVKKNNPDERIIKLLEDYKEILIKKGEEGIFESNPPDPNLFKINKNKINEDNIELITKLPFICFNINLIGKNGIDYDSLSSGEQSALRIRFYIEDIIKNKKQNTFFILLDEPTNDMHPDWQKRFLNYLINVFKDREEKFHFIVTSHSPFMISDLPKENIIFLKDGKQDKGIKHKQTFGANIHTLLSDSFFMKDGLMGEFAKGKINEIKEFYEKAKLEKKTDENVEFYKKHKEKFWQIQKIIGEPFLQKVIKNYLDELELLFSDDNTLIEKELADIKKRKIYLESLKNGKA